MAVRFALCFPEVYEIAQSHLGLQILYDILNRRSDVAAERCYAPWFDMEAALRAHGLPLVSLESHLAPARLPPRRLQPPVRAHLHQPAHHARPRRRAAPQRAADRRRSDRDRRRTVRLQSRAPGAVPRRRPPGRRRGGRRADRRRYPRAGIERDRPALLRALAAIAGVYVPAFFDPRHQADGTLAETTPLDPELPRVAKRILPDLDTFPPPANPIVPNLGVVHDRASVEVMRGCVKGCRFCQAGYVYRPLRERNPERVVAHTRELVARTGYDEVSLLSSQHRRLQRRQSGAQVADGRARAAARGGVAAVDAGRRALAAHPRADPPRPQDRLHARAGSRHAAPARRHPEGVPRRGAARRGAPSSPTSGGAPSSCTS